MWLLGLMTRVVLGEYAVGLGDATLMMMVGAFVGWQPVVCVLTFAPLCAIGVGLVVWLITGRPYISFGPYDEPHTTLAPKWHTVSLFLFLLWTFQDSICQH